MSSKSWFKASLSAVLATAFLSVGAAGVANAQTKTESKAPAKPHSSKPAAKAPAKKAEPRESSESTSAALPPTPSGPLEIQVWDSLNPAQAQAFDKVVQGFNDQQHGFTVKVTTIASGQALSEQAMAAVRAKKAPHLIEISDNSSPEFIAQQGAILPLYELLNKYPIKDLRWFLPQTTNATRDAKGRLLALPWMAEVPVYMYNRDLYKKAGLNPDAPPKTWREMQSHLVALMQSGVSCPYATSDQAWIHLENLSALHNEAYATHNNGLDAGNATLLVNDLLHVRHLALMMSWVRSSLFTLRTEGDQADDQFVSGKCAILTTGTGALANVQANAKFSYGIAPLPYYEEEASQPSNPFVGGSSLWALGGHSSAEQKAVAEFIAYLATPVVAAEWHQRTGFLPLTEAAFRASEVSYYKSIPGAEAVVEAMSKKPTQNTRGFSLKNYAQVSRILDQELDNIWNGSKPVKQGLDDAVARANAVLGPVAAAPAPRARKK